MKKTIKSVMCALSLLYLQGRAQIYDLRSGINNSNGQFLTVSLSYAASYDDTWQFMPPGATVYQPVHVSSGNMAPSFNTLPGRDYSVMWMTNAVDQWACHLPGQPAGYYYFQTTVDITACDLEVCRASGIPATLFFSHIGGDNVVNQLLINTASYPLTTPYNAFATNVNISINPNDLVVGANTITIRLENYEEYVGLEINGQLTITSAMNFKLRDKNEIEKSTFCLAEDVFLDPGAAKTNGYSILVIGSSGVLAMDNGAGQLKYYNITRLLKNNNVNVTVGTTYTVQYTLNTPCGTRKFEKTFEFECCQNSHDPTFGIMLGSNGLITGIPVSTGQHAWTIYSTPTVHTPNFTQVGTGEGNVLNYQGDGKKCYHIKHQLTNACGQTCDAQSVCFTPCAETTCILTAPVVTYNGGSNTITWPPVPGATSYVVVITGNDPACCNNGDPGPMMAPYAIQVTVNGLSYNLSGSLDNMPMSNCYSYKVYALCPDGTPGPVSNVICFAMTGDHGKMAVTAIMDAEIAMASFDLFPNPAKGTVNLVFNGEVDHSIDLRIVNAMGELVEHVPDQHIEAGGTLKIDISLLPKGIYLVTINLEGRIIQNKLVIE
jgi:hypothetical protein